MKTLTKKQILSLNKLKQAIEHTLSDNDYSRKDAYVFKDSLFEKAEDLRNKSHQYLDPAEAVLTCIWMVCDEYNQYYGSRPRSVHRERVLGIYEAHSNQIDWEKYNKDETNNYKIGVDHWFWYSRYKFLNKLIEKNNEMSTR